ncbi:MAG TPA: MEDS domain-containing protein [Bryobacteraceae bacterium]|nr:MEDS domain-containing protein [Bryobacteraceae bacterium]
MNQSGIAVLEDPHPCAHIVYPYTSEELITEAVGIFALAGLRKDESVIIVSTNGHLARFERYLRDAGIDVARVKYEGRLAIIDAWQMLGQISIDGMPDTVRFNDVLSPLVAMAKSESPSGRVRVFGEMVNLLWKNNPAAALYLEDLWNEAIRIHSVALLCTYALDGDSVSSRADLDAVCAAHSHTLPC